jgi:hypothetical protein
MRMIQVQTTDPAELSADELVGQRVTLIESSAAPIMWWFRFERCTLSVETVWRLISDSRVLVTGEDHGQMFGHDTPVDASALLREAVGDRPVTAAHLGPIHGDLTLEFAPTLYLQVFVQSSGYESWSLSKSDGSQLVATSGGRVSLYRPDGPTSQRP